METWASIEDFPPYEVSDSGRVRNGDNGRVLGIYDNGHGVLQVVIRRGNCNNARAIHRLVAEAFLDPAPDDCVPMHVDGDWGNNKPENLVWKPRWFAVKWTKQSKQTTPRDCRRVRVIKSGEVYPNALECAKAIGGVEEYVLITAQSRWETTYMGSRFEFVYN